MSSSNEARCADVTIPINTAVSNVIRADQQYADAVGVMIYAPAALDAHTFVFEVTRDPDAGTVVWNKYVAMPTDESPTDEAPPGAGLARAYFGLVLARAFRIKDSSSNVAAARTWGITKIYRTGIGY